ncbi:MAG: EamA family transporter RarD [Desulfobacteraceae bacterium]|jgi:chloramphenicol-sensitive protein RarD
MSHSQKSRTAIGYISALSSGLIWGVSPIYFKALSAVPPMEILMHRMVWSFLLLLILLFALRRWHRWLALIGNRRIMPIFIVTTLLVAGNWFVYIWAVTNGFIVQASLGYFIYPLVSVMLGVVFLRERLRLVQTMAVLLAGAGVAYMAVSHGQVPWISLALAFSFSIYALIRKVAEADALEGLTAETLLMSVPAILYLGCLSRRHSAVFLSCGWTTDGLLIGTALITAVPLLLFNIGGKRLPLSSLSFMQYLAPTCQFLIGVFLYREPFSTAQLVTFILTWLALIIFTADSIQQLKRLNAQ